MRIVIESLKESKAKVTLQLNGKEYSETWKKTDDDEFVNCNDYSTINKCISAQLEDEGIDIDEGLEELLDEINMALFMDLAESESEY